MEAASEALDWFTLPHRKARGLASTVLDISLFVDKRRWRSQPAV